MHLTCTFNVHFSLSVEYYGDPMAQIFLPIFDSFNRTTRKPVALITALVHWRAYFRDILPANIKGVDVVLENTCDGFFTFQVSKGVLSVKFLSGLPFSCPF